MMVDGTPPPRLVGGLGTAANLGKLGPAPQEDKVRHLASFGGTAGDVEAQAAETGGDVQRRRGRDQQLRA